MAPEFLTLIQQYQVSVVRRAGVAYLECHEEDKHKVSGWFGYPHRKTARLYAAFILREEKNKPKDNHIPMNTPKRGGNYIQSTKDQIESRHTEREIREMYAKYISGFGRVSDIGDMPIRSLRTALNEEYEVVINSLLANWPQFNRRVHLQAA